MNKEEMRQKLSNITQIRELLFGEQTEEYERKFALSQEKIKNIESNIEELNLNLDRFKSDIKEHLLQLKNALSEDINIAVDGLEKKIKYLSVNTNTEVSKINKKIEDKTKSNFQEIELVNDKISSQIKNIKEEASQTHENINKDIRNLRNQISEVIENNFSELTESKISRSDLAEVLFELCLKVKGQKPSLNEIESNNSNNINEKTADRELIFSEESNNQ